MVVTYLMLPISSPGRRQLNQKFWSSEQIRSDGFVAYFGTYMVRVYSKKLITGGEDGCLVVGKVGGTLKTKGVLSIILIVFPKVVGT